jgi:hypothetical protein
MDDVTTGMSDGYSSASYALSLADESHEWYRTAAIRSRKAYRLSEAALLIVSAGIPVAAAISPHNAIVPAILGGIVVVLSGLQVVFHWHDNYLRFSTAREAIEFERRLYHTGAKPYEDASTRDQNLVASVSRVEREEMARWTRVASDRPKT